MKFRFFSLFSAIFALLLVSFFTTAQNEMPDDTVWLLEGNRQAFLADNYFNVRPDHNIIGIVIIPEPVSAEVVGAAWTYAIRYGADGLDLPNFERAIEILMERHPTWKAYPTNGALIRYEMFPAELDFQEPTLTPEATENP